MSLLGDFNLISTPSEKQGDNDPNFRRAIEFREVIEFRELREVAFNGPPYTWDNSRGGGEFIQERIDLAFTNEDMLDRYPRIKLYHLERCNSDHVPIVLTLDKDDGDKGRPTERPFRFEAMWFSVEDSKEIIRNGCCYPGSAQAEIGICGKLAKCAEDLGLGQFCIWPLPD